MKFLVSNHEKELGTKVNFNQYKLSIFNILEPENLICEMLIENEVERKSVSFNGNVNIDMVKEIGVQLEIYKYIYIVEKYIDSWVIKDTLDNEIYVDLVLKLLGSDNLNIGYSRLYLLSQVLLSKPLKRDSLGNILNEIKVFINKCNSIDSGYVDLIKVMENIIPEDFENKKDYMNCLYTFLDKNEMLIYSLTCEEKSFLEQNSKKYNLDIYSKIKNVIRVDVGAEDLPF